MCMWFMASATILCPILYYQETGFTTYDVGFTSRRLLVIDAGSSHTCFDLYKMTSRSNVELDLSCKAVELNPLNPGIAHLDPNQIVDYLSPCMDHVSGFLNAIEGHAMFKPLLALGATAGMRELSASSTQEAQEVMTAVSDYLGSPFHLFDFVGAKVLNSTDEAKYDWVAANAFANNFDEGVGIHYGALDMGGASVELTLTVPLDSVSTSGHYVETVRINDQDYNLMLHGAQCYGILSFECDCNFSNSNYSQIPI